MTANDLSKRIVVRHRESGYLRFEPPKEICHPRAADAITQCLLAVPGVYRVTFDAPQRRVMVWFEAQACAAADVARAFKSALGALPEPDEVDAVDVDSTTPAAATSISVAVRQLGQWATAAREGIERLTQSKAMPGSLHARLQPVLVSALTEKAITNFLNDLIAFYLIKAHWELISQRWLKDPVKYANAWLSVFYLVFLLVRYRKSMTKPAPVISSGAVAPPVVPT
jgi:hypothetical protein